MQESVPTCISASNHSSIPAGTVESILTDGMELETDLINGMEPDSPIPLMGNNSVSFESINPFGLSKREEGCSIPAHGDACAPAGGSPSGKGGLSYPACNVSKYNNTNYKVVGRSIFQAEESFIYGCANQKTKIDCGNVWSIRVCSKDQSHKPEKRHTSCGEPTCPVCYKKHSHSLADGVCGRVKGYQEVYSDNPISHLVMSPPKGTRYASMKLAFASVTKKYLVDAGGEAATVWCHPYRIRKELIQELRDYQDKWRLDNPGKKPPGFWNFAHNDVLGLGYLGMYVRYGLHFHLLSSGFLIKSNEFCKKTKGWIYKKVIRDEGEDLGNSSIMLDENQIKKVANYLSTHCSWEWTKHSVRYIGTMSYANLGRTKVKTINEPVLCKICGHAVWEHAVSQLTGEICEVVSTDIRRRVITWQYWKREKRHRVKRVG